MKFVYSTTPNDIYQIQLCDNNHKPLHLISTNIKIIADYIIDILNDEIKDYKNDYNSALLKIALTTVNLCNRIYNALYVLNPVDVYFVIKDNTEYTYFNKVPKYPLTHNRDYLNLIGESCLFLMDVHNNDAMTADKKLSILKKVFSENQDK